MTLPTFNDVVYNTKIPSTGQTVKFHPFKVRDQKALMMAVQSEDVTVMIDTLKNILSRCLVGVDPNGLATFDLEYLFTQIRAKSVGEIVEVGAICQSCHAKTPVTIDLTKIEVHKNEEHTNKIPLGPDYGIVMRYPSLELAKTFDDNQNNIDVLFEVICASVDYVYLSDEVFYAKEYTPEKMLEFIEDLLPDQLEKILEFFKALPTLKYDLEFKCQSCKIENKIELKGVDNFF